MVFDRTVLYGTSPLFKRELKKGKTWIRLDLSKVQRSLGVDPTAIFGASTTNPGDQLEYLRAIAHVEKKGSEQVRGVPTTHYTGTIDLKDVPSHLPPAKRAASRQAVERLIEVQGGNSVTQTDVWVDEKKLVRRMRISMAFEVSGKKAGVVATVEFFDFGTTVAIPVPPKDEIEDFTDRTAAELRKQAR